MTTEQSGQQETVTAADAESPRATARAGGLFALGLGAVAVVSSWTGWGGVGVGLAAVLAAAVALWLGRRATPRPWPPAVAGLLLGLVAVGIGLALEWDTLFGADNATFGVGLTLDGCMQHADTAKLQHLCKSQHLDEFMRRYPNSDQ